MRLNDRGVSGLGAHRFIFHYVLGDAYLLMLGRVRSVDSTVLPEDEMFDKGLSRGR